MSGAGAGASSESDEEYQADSGEEVLSDEGEGVWRDGGHTGYEIIFFLVGCPECLLTLLPRSPLTDLGCHSFRMCVCMLS